MDKAKVGDSLKFKIEVGMTADGLRAEFRKDLKDGGKFVEAVQYKSVCADSRRLKLIDRDSTKNSSQNIFTHTDLGD